MSQRPRRNSESGVRAAALQPVPQAVKFEMTPEFLEAMKAMMVQTIKELPGQQVMSVNSAAGSQFASSSSSSSGSHDNDNSHDNNNDNRFRDNDDWKHFASYVPRDGRAPQGGAGGGSRFFV